MSQIANEINKTNAFLWRFSILTMGIICSIAFIAALGEGYVLTTIFMLIGAILGFSWFGDSISTNILVKKDKYDLAVEKQQFEKRINDLRW
jgi:hypothetical protein